MADDAVYADLLDALSPVSKAGLDPDEAAADRAGTMRTLMGDDANQTKGWWDQGQLEAQNNVPPRPGTSQNGNPLPPGLQVRQPGVPTPDAPTPGGPTTPASTGTIFPAGNELEPKTPAVPAGVTPSGSPSKPTATPDLAGANAASIALMQSDLAKASQDVDNEAKQPDEASVLAPLEQQRVNAAARQVELQSPYDANGKLLPEYKPTVGQRIMRGVGAVAQGIRKGGADGAILGVIDPAAEGATPYGAPNRDYAIDQTRAAERVAGADQQLQEAKDAWKAQSDRIAKVAADRRALATAGKDTTGASIEQQKVPQDQQKLDQEGTPKNEMEAIAAYGRETDPVKKAALWDTVQKMHQATMQEKPPREPGEHPSAELQEYADKKAAAIRENNGRPLSSAQLAALSGPTSKGAPTKAGFEALLKQRDADYTVQQKNYDEQKKAAAEDAEQLAAIDADNRSKLNDLQNGWNQRLADYDPSGILSHVATPAAPQTAPAPSAAAPPPSPPPTVGQIVSRKGQNWKYLGGPPNNPASWQLVKPKVK